MSTFSALESLFPPDSRIMKSLLVLALLALANYESLIDKDLSKLIKSEVPLSRL